MTRYYFPAAKPATPDKKTNPVAMDEYVTMLESKYPRILASITVMWGAQELNVFLRKLILDDRGGRQGFPPEAWDELNALSSLHLIIVPDNNPF
jgi:hypothetical protein